MPNIDSIVTDWFASFAIDKGKRFWSSGSNYYTGKPVTDNTNQWK